MASEPIAAVSHFWKTIQVSIIQSMFCMFHILYNLVDFETNTIFIIFRLKTNILEYQVVGID